MLAFTVTRLWWYCSCSLREMTVLRLCMIMPEGVIAGSLTEVQQINSDSRDWRIRESSESVFDLGSDCAAGPASGCGRRYTLHGAE
jgi:hypothetical protein